MKRGTLSLPDELHRALKKKAAEDGVKMGDLIQQAIREFLDPQRQPDLHGSSTSARPDNTHWHRILERVLNDPEHRIGIVENLRWADNFIRTHRQPKLVDADAEASERLFGEAIAGMEVLRTHHPLDEAEQRALETILSRLQDISKSILARWPPRLENQH